MAWRSRIDGIRRNAVRMKRRRGKEALGKRGKEDLRIPRTLATPHMSASLTHFVPWPIQLLALMTEPPHSLHRLLPHKLLHLLPCRLRNLVPPLALLARQIQCHIAPQRRRRRRRLRSRHFQCIAFKPVRLLRTLLFLFTILLLKRLDFLWRLPRTQFAARVLTFGADFRGAVGGAAEMTGPVDAYADRLFDALAFHNGGRNEFVDCAACGHESWLSSGR
jgi:hypothetical protein